MTKESWVWTTEEVLPSRLGAGAAFIERLLDRLAEHRWDQHDIFSIRLAMEEALVNAIKHGNRLDCGKQVRLVCKMSSQTLWVKITDEGCGFDPDALPDPTSPENLHRPDGRGVMLMRNFMSRVEFNETGNCVVMEKERAAQDQNPAR